MPKRVTITIDGRSTEVDDGATILAAARQLGVEIPTLCAIDGIEPLTSCFVCVVQVAGQRKLSPACATPVADGMVVTTDSPEVLAARKSAVELLLSDHLGECEAPCEISCPAGFRASAFMEHVAAGRFDSASRLAREDLVLPSAVGRICPRFCEGNCRRGESDQPVAIAMLHRYVSERELAAEGQILADASRCALPPRAAGTGKKVAIVGAGPAGLAAAASLLRLGHDCTIFDAKPEPGGVLRHGLDETRMPRAVLAGEVDAVRRMGAQFRMNTRLGRDVQLAELRQQFDAVLVATGAPQWERLSCPGGELPPSADEVIAPILDGGQPVEGDAIVIGAGQEAVELARMCKRGGAATVTLLSPRAKEQLPLLARAIEAARAEGVATVFGVQVQEIRRPALRYYVSGMARGAPVRLDANVLLIATGRLPEMTLLGEQGLELGKRGVAADRATLATNLPGVFVAGEAISGGGYCVRAIGQGRQAAESIDQFLSGRAVAARPRPHLVRYGKLSDEERAMLRRRATNDGPRARGFADEKAATDEAARCQICGCSQPHLCRLRAAATALGVDSTRFKGERRAMERDASHELVTYESHKCIMCGACVEIVSQAGLGEGLAFVGRGFNVRVAAPWSGRMADALGELAQRCAVACPTSALSLNRPPDAPPDNG